METVDLVRDVFKHLPPLSVVRLRRVSRTFLAAAKDVSVAWSVRVEPNSTKGVLFGGGDGGDDGARSVAVMGDLAGVRFACLGGRLERVTFRGAVSQSAAENLNLAFRGVRVERLELDGWDVVRKVRGFPFAEEDESLAHACVVLGGMCVTSLAFTQGFDEFSTHKPRDYVHLGLLHHGLVHLELSGSEALCPLMGHSAKFLSLGLLALHNLRTFDCDAFYCWSEDDEISIARLLATHPSLESLTLLSYPKARLFREARRLVDASSSKLRHLAVYYSEPDLEDLTEMVSFLRDLPRFEYLDCTAENEESLVEATSVLSDVEATLIDLFSTLARGPRFRRLHFYIGPMFDLGRIAAGLSDAFRPKDINLDTFFTSDADFV
mmetsp:Transcript_21150/g.65276  ORF Transcript_21150/g.65276 Transcript_21150/m.65276 type:complete len:379 (-) Transcript_21150:126-1262(-)